MRTVDNLTLSDKERDNSNREKIGYHVFLSQYGMEFQKLNPVQQQNIIGVKNNNNNNSNNDNNDHSTVPTICIIT